jgi:type II secretory pathway component GspD/PulD (secretin)
MKPRLIAAATLLALCSATALAQPANPNPNSIASPVQQPGSPTPVAGPAAQPLAPPLDGPTLDLRALLEQLGAEMDREFIVDPRVPLQLRVGNTAVDDADYESLLALLRVNGCMALEVADEQILVVPESNMRFLPTPIVQEDNARISDHAIVTRIIEVPGTASAPPAGSADAPPLPGAAAQQLVPWLRPMLPANAHLVATGNYLIIVDRYDNVRRIAAVIQALTE